MLLSSPPLPPRCAQVKYSATQPALPVGLSGETFSAVFGANQVRVCVRQEGCLPASGAALLTERACKTAPRRPPHTHTQSPAEALVLKRRVMGPGWLALKQPRRVAPEAQVCVFVCVYVRGAGWACELERGRASVCVRGGRPHPMHARARTCTHEHTHTCAPVRVGVLVQA